MSLYILLQLKRQKQKFVFIYSKAILFKTMIFIMTFLETCNILLWLSNYCNYRTFRSSFLFGWCSFQQILHFHVNCTQFRDFSRLHDIIRVIFVFQPSFICQKSLQHIRMTRHANEEKNLFNFLQTIH